MTRTGMKRKMKTGKTKRWKRKKKMKTWERNNHNVKPTFSQCV